MPTKESQTAARNWIESRIGRDYQLSRHDIESLAAEIDSAFSLHVMIPFDVETINLSYAALATMLKRCKQDSFDGGAGDPRPGYEQLLPEQAQIADACWRKGMDDLENTVLNWMFNELAAQRIDGMTTDELLAYLSSHGVDVEKVRKNASEMLATLAEKFKGLPAATMKAQIDGAVDRAKTKVADA